MVICPCKLGFGYYALAVVTFPALTRPLMNGRVDLTHFKGNLNSYWLV